jgi:hypothetical protein
VVLVVDKLMKFEAFMALLTPVILIGGMASGLFTPTEAAVAAVAWALFLGFVWYRTLSWRMLVKISMETIETTATVLFIVASASIFAWVLTTTQATEASARGCCRSVRQPDGLPAAGQPVFLLFVGCFMETIAAITILVPVFMPIIAKLGIDPIHFGLILVLNLMIGLLTPPVGMVLFVLQKCRDCRSSGPWRRSLPWMIAAVRHTGADHLRAADWCSGCRVCCIPDRPRKSHAQDRCVDVLQVDLAPKVPRSDAIQSFVTQETPMVRITTDDGAVGTGYSYTIGTGGSSVMALLARPPGAALIGREAGEIEADLEGSVLPHPRHRVGAITALALAPSTRRCGTLRCRAPGCRCGAWPAARRTGAGLHDRRAAGCTWRPMRWSSRVARRPRPTGFRGAKIKVGRPTIVRGHRAARRRCARPSARLRDHDRRQPGLHRVRGDPARAPLRAARHRLVRGAAAGRGPGRPRAAEREHVDSDRGGRVDLLARSISANTCSASACSIVQADVARIGGITPWLKVAHLAESFNVPICPHFLMELHVVALRRRAQRALGRVHPAARPPSSARSTQRWPGGRPASRHWALPPRSAS